MKNCCIDDKLPNYTAYYLLGGDKGLHGVGHDKGQVLGHDKEQVLGHELGQVTLLGEGLGHGRELELEHGKVLELVCSRRMELELGLCQLRQQQRRRKGLRSLRIRNFEVRIRILHRG